MDSVLIAKGADIREVPRKHYDAIYRDLGYQLYSAEEVKNEVKNSDERGSPPGTDDFEPGEHGTEVDSGGTEPLPEEEPVRGRGRPKTK